MRRRQFLWLAVGSAGALPRIALAQSPPRMLRVGTVNVQAKSSPNWAVFAQSLAERGYVEGRNLIYDHVQVPNVEAWDALCREMVARKPDIIVAAGPEQSLKSARAAAGALPIVMVAVDYDPIARGHIASLARPGGTVTGVYFQTAELAAKHLQLMREVMPGLASATVLWDRPAVDYWTAIRAAAPRVGVRLIGVELRERPYDYERVFANMAADDRRFVFAMASPFFLLDRVRLAEVAIRHRSALMGLSRFVVDAGALISYGANIRDMFALAADYVDRLAKGAKPADLAVRQPTKFALSLNLKTARAIGLTIPPLLLAQADEVIE